MLPIVYSALAFPNRFPPPFPFLSDSDSVTSGPQCAHPIVEETLVPGEPANIAMSVVLSLMLHTTAKFNALQILMESHKFDMNEPLIFRRRWNLTASRTDWGILKMNPSAMAISLDKRIGIADPDSFILIKILVRTCSLNLLEMDLRAVSVSPSRRHL